MDILKKIMVHYYRMFRVLIKYFIYFVFELLNIFKIKKDKRMYKEKKRPLATLMYDLLVGHVG
jgi:hypothetical protein